MSSRMGRTAGAALAERRSVATPESDAELIAKVAADNLAALGALYDRHHEAVRAFVIRATINGSDTDDLVQETFMTLLRVAKNYDARASARPFLIGIAARLTWRRTRAFARWARVLSVFQSTSQSSFSQNPEDAAGIGEDVRMLGQALARLSEEKRLVLLMIDGEQLTGDEVAEALGIPVATVRTRLHYARAEIRRMCAKRRSR